VTNKVVAKVGADRVRGICASISASCVRRK